MNDYWKYHGLGNDYLVLEPGRFTTPPSAEAVKLICDRHLGIGADGILWGPLTQPPWASGDDGSASATHSDGEMALVIYNSDGSEGEKSGNGLRIFARHVWERKLHQNPEFVLLTRGGPARAEILTEDGGRVAMEMGQVRFDSASIPVAGEPREVLRETLEVAGREVVINGATVGNPHCVVLVGMPTPELARELGPILETHHLFPNRTNVQFMRPLDDHAIQIEIWERGSGYTLASGTSSCAAAAVAVKLGLCQSPVTVNTQGGPLLVTLDSQFNARLEGDVASVGGGDFSPEFLSRLGLHRTS